MATTISDNGAKITIVIGTTTRQVLKSQIRNVSVISSDTIFIETTQGTARNIFIPFADVTSPSCTDAPSLRDTILSYLEPAAGPTGLATEARQIEGNSSLTALLATLGSIQTFLSSIDDKSYYQPLLIDLGSTGTSYKGYAHPGTLQSMTGWAIERIQTVDGVETHTWASGTKSFVNVWNNRASLTYK